MPKASLTIGRAALEARDLAAARAASLRCRRRGAGGRPTARVCLLMADIETADGADGAAREWLARAARAPRDKAWIADGRHQRPLGARRALGRARRLRLAHAGRTPERAGAGARRRRPRRRRSTCGAPPPPAPVSPPPTVAPAPSAAGGGADRSRAAASAPPARPAAQLVMLPTTAPGRSGACERRRNAQRIPPVRPRVSAPA